MRELLNKTGNFWGLNNNQEAFLRIEHFHEIFNLWSKEQLKEHLLLLSQNINAKSFIVISVYIYEIREMLTFTN